VHQPIIGFNYGAEKYKRVKQCAEKSAHIHLHRFICRLAVFSDFPAGHYFRIRLGRRTVHSFCSVGFPTVLMGVFAAGFQIPMSGYFQSVGKSTKASLLSLTRQIFFLIPLILIFPLIWGLEGYFVCGTGRRYRRGAFDLCPVSTKSRIC
jgi:Na+-driven multidrug efflux pump